jgi:hypothetical protein
MSKLHIFLKEEQRKKERKKERKIKKEKKEEGADETNVGTWRTATAIRTSRLLFQKF